MTNVSPSKKQKSQGSINIVSHMQFNIDKKQLLNLAINKYIYGIYHKSLYIKININIYMIYTINIYIYIYINGI